MTAVQRVRIREAGAADASALSLLAADTFTETFGHLYKPDDLSGFLKNNHSAAVYSDLLADEEWKLWLAEEDGEAVAYCVAGPCTLPVPDMPENSGELARLYMKGSQKGRGLGGDMLELALAWMRARFEHIYLSVYHENVRAQKLYSRFGFVKIHDYFYMVGDHADPEWIMELRE